MIRHYAKRGVSSRLSSYIADRKLTGICEICGHTMKDHDTCEACGILCGPNHYGYLYKYRKHEVCVYCYT
ncbi:hypothetical protein LCGC14_2975910, partial [marine sediment metagenome]